MKKNYKKYLVPSILVVSMLFIVLTTTSVLAQDSTNYPTIVQRLAEKFNLNETEVQEVFNEVRDEKQAEIYALWEDRLDDAVADSLISAGQKQLILDKHQEMHDKMQSLQSLNFEERNTEMQKLHDEMRTWADDNNIDLRQLGPLGKMGNGMRGFRHAGYVHGITN